MNAIMTEVKIARRTLRQEGVRAVFKKYGWKLVAGLIAYYIVRDVTLYILLPFLFVKHFG